MFSRFLSCSSFPCSQEHELEPGSTAIYLKGGSHFEVVDSYRNFFLFHRGPSEGLLKVHEGLYGRGSELYSLTTAHPRKGLIFRISSLRIWTPYRALSRIQEVRSQGPENPHCPGCPFHTVESGCQGRTRCQRIRLQPFNIGTYHGHSFYDGFLVCSREFLGSS